MIRIFEQVAAGVSTADVADSLTRDGIPTPRVSSAREKGIRECIVSTKWSSSTIRDLIREPTYKGVCRGRLTMPSNRRRKNGTRLMVPRPDDQRVALKDPRTTPLVSDELWEKANRALTARRNREPSRRIPNPDFMLYGLIFCGREGCGCRMTGIHQKNTWGGHSRMYRCSGNAGNRLHRNGCVRTLGAIWLEANVWQKVTDIIMTPGLLEQKLAEIEVSKIGETIQCDLKAAINRRKKISK